MLLKVLRFIQASASVVGPAYGIAAHEFLVICSSRNDKVDNFRRSLRTRLPSELTCTAHEQTVKENSKREGFRASVPFSREACSFTARQHLAVGS